MKVKDLIALLEADAGFRFEQKAAIASFIIETKRVRSQYPEKPALTSLLVLNSALKQAGLKK